MSRARSTNLLVRLCLLAGAAGALPVAGCGPSGSVKNLPRDAAPMATGRSGASFVATRPGQVYVTDQTADRILYRRHINLGDTVEVRAGENRVLVNGKPVSQYTLDPTHQFQIYFNPDHGK